MSKPPEVVTLEWTGEDLRFLGRRDGHVTPIDGHGGTGPNPVALLLESIAGCMASDIVDILEKGRQDLRELAIEIEADRMEKPPRYVHAIRFVIRIGGDVEEARARRAVELSFRTYCSVWHSLRDDLECDWDLVLSGD